MLNKQKTVDIADSNIAGLGTELEKNVRLHAAETEKAWKAVGQTPGTLVWRIENFQVVAQPKEQFGEFFSGDSYIILHSYKVPDVEKLKHNVHFWLGLETTQDEAGTAAYKTVELDDFLGGEPVQYREVQGYETKLFLDLFSKKFMVSEGGVASGFRHVEPTKYETRLYQVNYSKKNLVVRQVPLSSDSLNSGDIFILDKGLKILQWNGSKANGQERSKAMQFTQALCSERGSAKTTVFDEGDKDLDEFWEALGGEGKVAPPSEELADIAQDKSKMQLVCVSDESGELKQTVVATGSISKAMFKSEDVFIFNSGVQIFVWIGKGATPLEKKSGMNFAMQYIASNKLPATMPVSRILEGGENEQFNSLLDA